MFGTKDDDGSSGTKPFPGIQHDDSKRIPDRDHDYLDTLARSKTRNK
jgi:hypothetical protein